MERREITKEWKAVKRTHYQASFHRGQMGLMTIGMSGSKEEHMLVSYHQKVRELGYFYTCQSLAEGFWGRDGRQ